MGLKGAFTTAILIGYFLVDGYINNLDKKDPPAQQCRAPSQSGRTLVAGEWKGTRWVPSTSPPATQRRPNPTRACRP